MMKYGQCVKLVKEHKLSVKEPSISLFMTVYEKETGKRIRKVSEFCNVYISFLDVGEMLFGGTWKVLWRRELNMRRIKMFRCIHCGQIFELRTSVEHIIKYMKDSGILQRVVEECQP